ncbi:MAG: CcmD family protein [Cyclobacteriaceae bacterium]
MLRRLVMFFGVVILNLIPAASQEVEMADGFRSEGKIYVVVGVILIILIGLFVYLFRMDRRIKKLEEK